MPFHTSLLHIKAQASWFTERGENGDLPLWSAFEIFFDPLRFMLREAYFFDKHYSFVCVYLQECVFWSTSPCVCESEYSTVPLGGAQTQNSSTLVTLRGPAHSMSKPNWTNLNQTLIPKAIWAAETRPEPFPSRTPSAPGQQGARHSQKRRFVAR